MGSDFAQDVLRGLTRAPKSLPPKYFYDNLGSALFEAICHLPEYYVSRAEEEILRSFADDIVHSFGTPIRLIEIGSGSSRKTRVLLERLAARQQSLEYVTVDVDAEMLRHAAATLSELYPTLTVRPVEADFRMIGDVLQESVGSLRSVVLFLGSTIGNLDRVEQEELLRSIRGGLRPGDLFFLGTDQRKAKDILEPAYDDPLGVTAAFNLNLLVRINRTLGGHFDLAKFRHRAFFNEMESRIEMHIVSAVAQRVRIDAVDVEIGFAAGETIHTENSYKFDQAEIAALGGRTGFEIARRWTDARGLFADTLLAVPSTA